MAATEEVTVSMGDMVMVKAAGECDPDDPNKTQVILQLQPITTGYVVKYGAARGLKQLQNDTEQRASVFYFPGTNLQKQMQPSWLLKHTQVGDYQSDVWTCGKVP